jgi:hypothetical protein
MLVTFKSKSAASVSMYEEHAKAILDLLGKDTERGVITAAETGDAITALETEIEKIKNNSAAESMSNDDVPDQDELDNDSEHHQVDTVKFSIRVFPFLEMLRAAHKDGNSVTWGV